MSIIGRKRFCLFNVFRPSNCRKTIMAIVFLFLFTISGAQQSQMEGPQNTLSIVGSNVTLKCSAPSGNCSGVDWQKYIPQNNPETVFSDRNGILSTYRDRYSVDNSSGCDLVIKDVKLTDAGRFTCRVFIAPNTFERSAFLVILNAQPRCAINASLDDTMEGDGVQLTCEMMYTGTHNASMLWKELKGTPAAVENGNTIRRSFSVVASAPEVPSFTCVTSFEVNATGVTGLALNIPTTACEIPAIKVLYPVRSVTLSPSHSYYAPGTNITCTAMGNPAASFKWQALESENGGTWIDIPNQNSSTFSVSNATSKGYRCVAMNVVRGKRYNATSDEFRVNNTGEDNGSVTATTTTVNPLAGLHLIVSIAVGAGVGVLVLIILLAICFCVRSCPGYKCCHPEKNSKHKIREEQPLTVCPDIYSNVNQIREAPKAKPRSAPTSEPPKRPQEAPPQAKPRTDIPKANPVNNYQHEEVTYAELARENAPRHIATTNNNVPQESVYADVTTA